MIGPPGFCAALPGALMPVACDRRFGVEPAPIGASTTLGSVSPGRCRSQICTSLVLGAARSPVRQNENRRPVVARKTLS